MTTPTQGTTKEKQGSGRSERAPQTLRQKVKQANDVTKQNAAFKGK